MFRDALIRTDHLRRMFDSIEPELLRDETKAKGTPVFALVVAGFFNAPAVDEIDLSHYSGKTGETIHIRASDDFEVAGVSVLIRDASGAALEQGAASGGGDGAWTYTTTASIATGQTVAIEVAATDHPGNKTTKAQSKS